jgi:hypothetical protein
MKNVKFITFSLVTLMLGSMISCEKKADTAAQGEKVKKILELEARMNALNSGTGMMTNYMSVIGYSQYRNGSLNISGSDSGAVYPDSVSLDSAGYWVPITCAKVTESDNPDGTHTTEYDYGDGCTEYGSFTKGKITYIWKNSGNDYYSVVMYDHYYSSGSELNGESKYSFTSDGSSTYRKPGGTVTSDSSVSMMPVLFNWSGTSVGHDELTVTYDNGNITVMKSDYTNVWDSTSYKVMQGDFYYSEKSEGYVYHYQVIQPLVTSYKCPTVWIPVSGIEKITNSAGGVTDEYTLNYGDGNCDNMAMLTENGKTSWIDFSGPYFVMPMSRSNKATPAVKTGK